MFLVRTLVVIVFFSLTAAISTQADERCREPVGTLAAIEGRAEVRLAGQTRWEPARQHHVFCPGDLLRIGNGGRAAIVLVNETVLRLKQNSTLTFAGEQAGRSLLELLNGALHIFSHRPRSLQVVTPFLNGAVEGTEFLVVAETDRSQIIVFSGLVRASNEQGSTEVTGGQAVAATAGSPPHVSLTVTPRDAVQWSVYYPSILADSRTTSPTETQKALHLIAEKLKTGQASEAKELCEQVLAKAPDNSEALAMLAIIEVVQNRRESAFALATRAIASDRRSAAAALALSYAHQAAFNTDQALRVLENTAHHQPSDGLLLARLAELQLATGHIEAAKANAERASAAAPRSGLVKAIQGFIHLARLEIDAAAQAFSEAISHDQMLPLARLGYGLTLIRRGALAEGRAALELAVALDPGSSLLRSYLGKAYAEERRNTNAQRQYRVAQELDPADPTPWFYDALRKQAENRPVEALHDLQESIARNDNRAVYRSRLLLDDDLAARSAGLGRIYRDLGFEQQALAHGRQSVAVNPANHSAHRLLADSYHALPRHEIARVSELLQAQLLQPLNLNPVQPLLAEDTVLQPDAVGPGFVSLHEFSPLFLSNGLAATTSGLIGDNQTFGDEVTLSGINNRMSFSVGQYHLQSNGFRPNNDQQIDLFNAFFQDMLSPRTSLLAELRYRQKTFGDLTLRFNPDDYLPTLDQDDEITSLRVGGRHDFGPDQTLIGTAIASTTDGTAGGIEAFGASMEIGNDTDNLMIEAQHLARSRQVRLQSGAGYLVSSEEEKISLAPPLQVLSQTDSTVRHANAYSYAHIDLSSSCTATIGLSGDLLDDPTKDREELNPKLGFACRPLGGTTWRGAVFKTVQRRLVYAQTIEPTQVAGFNQFFDDFAATSAWTYGIGMDQNWSPDWSGGLSFYHRQLNVPFPSVGPDGIPVQREDDWREDSGTAYLYWTPYRWAALGLTYRYERFTHDQWEGPQGIAELETHRLTPHLRLFHPSGLRAAIEASYLDQRGDFGATEIGFTSDSDRFWVVDLALGYRLPDPRAAISLEIHNLFDESLHLLDTDPAQPRFLPERQVLLRLTVSW